MLLYLVLDYVSVPLALSVTTYVPGTKYIPMCSHVSSSWGHRPIRISVPTSASWPVEAVFKHDHNSRNMAGCTVLAFSPENFLACRPHTDDGRQTTRQQVKSCYILLPYCHL